MKDILRSCLTPTYIDLYQKANAKGIPITMNAKAIPKFAPASSDFDDNNAIPPATLKI